MTATIPTISENRFRDLEPWLGSNEYLTSSPRAVFRQLAKQRHASIQHRADFLRARTAIRHRAFGDWLEIAGEQLAAIADLGPGWDSHGADPPSLDSIHGAWNLLQSLDETGLVPRPHIYPSRSGGVQLEWEIGQRYLEIELLSEAEAEYFYSDPSTRSETEGKLHEGESLDEVVALIDRMYE